MRQVDKKQILRNINSENNWWSEPNEVPIVYTEMESRLYKDIFYPLMKNREVNRAVVLMGPRRVGKTVMLLQCVDSLLKEGVGPKDIFYLSLDHPLYIHRGLDELLGYYAEIAERDLNKDKCYVIFDEIQYLRDWEMYLKRLVDKYPNIKFVASGSAAAALKLKSQESGAGRFTDFILPPLLFYEYLVLTKNMERGDEDEFWNYMESCLSANGIKKINELFLDYINFGGYPEVALSEEIRKDVSRYIKNDIIDKVLLRDLPSLYGIADVQELNSFFTTLVYNAGEEVSYEALSKLSGVTKTTIKKYIEYLESAFLIRKIEKLNKNAKRFKRQTAFKIYLTNPSMRSAVFGSVQADDHIMGQLVENAMFAQGCYLYFPLFYGRWQKGEVDFVRLDKTSKIIEVMEIKWSDRYFTKPDELKSLVSFCHENEIEKATITTLSKFGNKKYKSIELAFLPVGLTCLSEGYADISVAKPNIEGNFTTRFNYKELTKNLAEKDELLY